MATSTNSTSTSTATGADVSVDESVIKPSAVSCQTCSTRKAIYTCPRCGFRSCSLPCLNAHKIGRLDNANNNSASSLNGASTSFIVHGAGSSYSRSSSATSAAEGKGGVGRPSAAGCSGVKENNAGGYVNMNVYGYQAFVQDYVFLEELGRRASEWGRDIQKRKLGTNDGGNQVSFAPGTKGGSKDGRNVGKNYHRQHRHHHARTKREILKERLEEDYEIEMLLLPEGMERRKVNQSTWDAKTSKVYLTAQYRFHRKFPSPSSQMTTTPSKSRINAVKDDSKTAQTEDESPIPILTHRNELDRSIHETLKRSIRERRPKKADSVPNWVTKMWDKMLEADIQSTVQKQRSHGDSLESPVAAKRTYCVLLATEASSAVAPFAQKRKTPRRKYVEVEMGDTFASVLKQKTFAEFPVFEVVPFGDYSDLLERDAMDEEEAAEVFDIFSYGNDQTDEGSSQGGEEETESNDEVGEPKRKRRKVDEEAGKRLFDGLMDYGDGTDSNASEMGEDGGLDIKRQKSAGSVQPEGGKGAGGLLGSLDYSSDESSSESEGEESKGHVMPEGGHPKPVEERYTLTTGEADGELEVDWD